MDWQEANQRNKQRILDYWQDIDAASPSGIAQAAARHLGAEMHWRGPAPLLEGRGGQHVAEVLLKPLRTAVPGLRRELHMFFGGQSSGRADGAGDGRMWVCGTGYLTGEAKADFLGIPLARRPLRIRWAEFYRFDGDSIAECQMLLDFPDWFEQAERPVLPLPRGAPSVYPAPTAFDGILTAAQEPLETNETLALIREFLFEGLNSFDSENLSSMGVARYFHPNVKWYGPSGIGACLGLREFETLHQQPWLIAFPDRKVQDLDSLFAEGRLTGSSGWRAVIATQSGPYLDCPPTMRSVEFNGIDFWLRTGNVFTENWVFVDMVHLFAQLGYDLFDRMKHAGSGRPTLIPVMPGDGA